MALNQKNDAPASQPETSFRAGIFLAFYRSVNDYLTVKHKSSPVPQPRAESDSASGRFQRAMRRILSVPKEELARREAAYQKERAAERARSAAEHK
jgi:hypothetical protein